MTNSADPVGFFRSQLSGSTLFAKTGHVVFSKTRVKKHFFRDGQVTSLGFAFETQG